MLQRDASGVSFHAVQVVHAKPIPDDSTVVALVVVAASGDLDPQTAQCEPLS